MNPASLRKGNSMFPLICGSQILHICKIIHVLTALRKRETGKQKGGELARGGPGGRAEHIQIHFVLKHANGLMYNHNKIYDFMSRCEKYIQLNMCIFICVHMLQIRIVTQLALFIVNTIKYPLLYQFILIYFLMQSLTLQLRLPWNSLCTPVLI